MNRQLRAEFLKQRTTRTTIGMVAAMLGVALVAIALHAYGLSIEDLGHKADQLGIYVDVGGSLGALFAALLGATAMTGEVRHGTIRPTFLSTPQRGRVVAAKAVVSLLTGIAFGVLATALAAGAGALFLRARGVTLTLDAGDYALLIAGGAIAAALWAVIGLGVGAVVRSQVPAVVGLFVWMLFVENLVREGLPTIGKFTPGALARTLAGDTRDTLRTPAIGAIVLGCYAALALVIGWRATTRRDVA